MNKILVIGTGSVARRHINNIFSIKPNISVDLFSVKFLRAKNFCKKIINHKIVPIKFNDLINNSYSHVIIASKTIYHNKYLKIFLEKKCKVYCEKPLPFDKIFNFLEKKSKNIKNNLKVTIGFQFRFNPAIEFIKNEIKKNKDIYLIKFFVGQNLKQWRPSGDYRNLFSAGNKYYASVFWELCHEIDILNYIFKKPKFVYSNFTNTQKLNLQINDVSVSHFKFSNSKANCILSSEMLSPILYRRLILISLDYYYEVDLVKNIIIKIDKNNKIKKYFFNKNNKNQRNDMFLNLMKKFLETKKNSSQYTPASLKDGLIVTKIIKKMIKSNQLGRVVKI